MIGAIAGASVPLAAFCPACVRLLCLKSQNDGMVTLAKIAAVGVVAGATVLLAVLWSAYVHLMHLGQKRRSVMVVKWPVVGAIAGAIAGTTVPLAAFCPACVRLLCLMSQNIALVTVVN